MCNQRRGDIDLWGMGSVGKTWLQSECQIQKKKKITPMRDTGELSKKVFGQFSILISSNDHEFGVLILNPNFRVFIKRLVLQCLKLATDPHQLTFGISLEIFCQASAAVNFNFCLFQAFFVFSLGKTDGQKNMSKHVDIVHSMDANTVKCY